MKSLKNPMTNAIYIALITAIYAIIFIVSSELYLNMITFSLIADGLYLSKTKT